MKIRVLFAAAICLVLATAAIPASQTAAQPTLASLPQRGTNFTLPGSDVSSGKAGKWPDIEASGRTLHMASNPNEVVDYWTKQDTATSASDPTTLGTVSKSTTYENTAIAVGPDGTLYQVWISQGSGIRFKHKPANGSWDANHRTIHSSGSFLNGLNITVSSNNQIFVTWNESALLRYKQSTDGGNNWSSSNVLSSKAPRGLGVAQAASGPHGEVIVAFSGADWHIYAAIWNGSEFNTSDVTPDRSNSDFFADPTAAVGPDGKYYVAWRRSPGNIYYSERQSDGSWPRSRLAGGDVRGLVSIKLDAGNNLHISWISNASGNYDVWYAFKPANGDWQGPVQGESGSGLFLNDTGIAGTVGDLAYGHILYERFNGSNASVRYQLFSSQGAGAIGATPHLNGNPQITVGGKQITSDLTPSLTFTNVTGSPNSVRYHWDSNADTTVAFNSSITIPAPSGVNNADCDTHTLSVSVGKSGGQFEQPHQIPITFDRVVQASVSAVNPYLAGLPTVFTQGVAAVQSPGAWDGDPAYTRITMFYLGINGQNECSGLASFAVTGQTMGQPITNNLFQGRETLPGSSVKPGQRPPFTVTVTDKVSNINNENVFTLTYDPPTDPSDPNYNGHPKINSGTVQADPANSVIRTLTFNNVNISDNLYPGAHFWGVWIANAPGANATEPATSDPARWAAVRVLNPGPSFTVDWSIFGGLGFTDLKNHPGTYTIFVRFLDGAGNPSETNIKTTATLTAGYTLPTRYLPLVAK